jgi:hypothetical protein
MELGASQIAAVGNGTVAAAAEFVIVNTPSSDSIAAGNNVDLG